MTIELNKTQEGMHRVYKVMELPGFGMFTISAPWTVGPDQLVYMGDMSIHGLKSAPERVRQGAVLTETHNKLMREILGKTLDQDLTNLVKETHAPGRMD